MNGHITILLRPNYNLIKVIASYQNGYYNTFIINNNNNVEIVTDNIVIDIFLINVIIYCLWLVFHESLVCCISVCSCLFICNLTIHKPNFFMKDVVLDLKTLN